MAVFDILALHWLCVYKWVKLFPSDWFEETYYYQQLQELSFCSRHKNVGFGAKQPDRQSRTHWSWWEDSYQIQWDQKFTLFLGGWQVCAVVPWLWGLSPAHTPQVQLCSPAAHSRIRCKTRAHITKRSCISSNPNIFLLSITCWPALFNEWEKHLVSLLLLWAPWSWTEATPDR